MFKIKKVRRLEANVEDLQAELRHSQERITAMENLIEVLETNVTEVKKSRDDLKKQKDLFEGRTAMSETKLSRIRNAIASNPDDDQQAFKEIKNIIFGKNGKHSK